MPTSLSLSLSLSHTHTHTHTCPFSWDEETSYLEEKGKRDEDRDKNSVTSITLGRQWLRI